MKLLVFGLAQLACSARSAPPPTAAEVVFVCEHGAAKSVVASQYFNQLAAERGLAIRSIARGAPRITMIASQGCYNVTTGV